MLADGLRAGAARGALSIAVGGDALGVPERLVLRLDDAAAGAAAPMLSCRAEAIDS